VTSSRKIEKATHESVPFRVLAANQHPDHDTIAEFRRRHLSALSGLFVQVLRLCQRAGLVRLGQSLTGWGQVFGDQIIDVAVEANRYPVPLDWAGQRVEVRLLAEELWITRTGADPVRHVRLQGKHQVARWEGPPRRLPARGGVPPAGAPKLDPDFFHELGEVEGMPLLNEAHQ